jgi:hypothetical protein
MTDEGVSLKGLVAKMLGPAVVDLVGGVADQSLPDCVACNKNAVPLRCIVCGSYVCQDHGYHSLSRREAVCRQCILDFMSSEHVDLSPWEVLGVPDCATRGEIERAFRLKAKMCHPDRVGNDPAKAQEFRRLQWAKEAALEKAAR